MNRKFLYLVSALLWLNSSTAMNFLKSSEPVITKPYTPGFMAKHPYISKTTQTGAAAALAYVAARFIQTEPSISPVVIGAIAATGACIVARNSKPRLIDALLTNPLIALNHIYKVKETVAKKLDKDSEQLDSQAQLTLYKNLIAQYAKESPLFLLGECRKEEEKICTLSRAYQPEYRKLYEDAVVTSLLEKLNKQQAVNYTSFGSGAAFQDMVILTKTLCQKPNATMQIHLVDTKHATYVAAQNYLGNKQHQITTEQNTNITEILDELVQFVRENGGATAEDSDLDIKDWAEQDIASNESHAQQFIKYLQTTFPGATLSLHLHSSTPDYVKYLDANTNVMNYPDVLTAADIEDEESKDNNAGGAYLYLCKKTLEQNRHSYNVYLNKCSTGVNLTTIFLTNKSDREPFNLTINNGQKITLFANNQNITKSSSIFSRIMSYIFG
jgi:hypothetical protein